MPPAQFSDRISGGLGGVQVGYGMQTGPFVYGVEALVNGSFVRGEQMSSFGAADDRFELDLQALASATGRLGYAWDSALVYVKGGVAAALLKVSVSGTGPPTTGTYLWNIDVPNLHWVAARLNVRMN